MQILFEMGLLKEEDKVLPLDDDMTFKANSTSSGLGRSTLKKLGIIFLIKTFMGAKKLQFIKMKLGFMGMLVV